MENASKALIMAGGVLIAILLVTFGIYIFKTMANSSANIYSELEQSNISEFNQKFLNYEQKDEELTIQDVVTIIHLAKDNNESRKLPTEVIVKVRRNRSTRKE